LLPGLRSKPLPLRKVFGEGAGGQLLFDELPVLTQHAYQLGRSLEIPPHGELERHGPRITGSLYLSQEAIEGQDPLLQTQMSVSTVVGVVGEVDVDELGGQ
jgi:hypothetical protein